MNGLWNVKNPYLLEEIKNTISDKYPFLATLVDKNTVFIKGRLQIFDGNKKLIDEFLIEIVFPQDFPVSIPVVTETGGRIPKIADRHFYTNGYACLFVPDERWRHYPEGSSIEDFIEKCVKPFFINQSYFEINGKWLFGERPHGSIGISDYYSEELGTNDAEVINTFVLYLSKKEIKGHWFCYCGSGKKLRNCHIQKVIGYRNKTNRKVAEISYERLIGKRL